jgi:hypothetical protein
MTEFNEQVEAEKLRQCRAIIEDTLREFDVCASVHLAGRGRFEDFLHVTASWSNLYLVELPGGVALRLRSKLADYNGDKEAQRRDQEWSVGVVSGLAIALGQSAMAMMHAAEQFDKATGAEHTPMRRDDPRDEP